MGDRSVRRLIISVIVFLWPTVSFGQEESNELAAPDTLSVVPSDWWTPGLVLDGQAKQNNGSSWPVRIEVQSNLSARISYDSIPCAGELKLILRSEYLVRTEEKITENKSNCIDGGVVEVARIDGEMFSYTWEMGSDKARGTLKSNRPLPPISEGQEIAEAPKAQGSSIVTDSTDVGSSKLNESGTDEAGVVPDTASVGGTIVANGVIDITSLNFETHLALAVMLGMKDNRLEADIPAPKTGDVFADARKVEETKARVYDYAEDFEEIIAKNGALRLQFENVPLAVLDPRLKSGSSMFSGELYEVGRQSLCGLPSAIVLDGPSTIDKFVSLGYPEMEWVFFNRSADCGEERQLGISVDQMGIIRRDRMLFDYLFNDMAVAERMYRKFRENGVLADVTCVINQITREPTVNLVCNLESLMIKSTSGERIYEVNWSNDKYVDVWGDLRPLPN